MKLTRKISQKKLPNSPSSVIQTTDGCADDQTPEALLAKELWEEVLADEELWKQHVELLLATPGNEHLNGQEARDHVEAMLRYVTLLCEIVVTQE